MVDSWQHAFITERRLWILQKGTRRQLRTALLIAESRARSRLPITVPALMRGSSIGSTHSPKVPFCWTPLRLHLTQLLAPSAAFFFAFTPSEGHFGEVKQHPKGRAMRRIPSHAAPFPPSLVQGCSPHPSPRAETPPSHPPPPFKTILFLFFFS